MTAVSSRNVAGREIASVPPRTAPARPNLEDVAARAGVSRATVSRVVNGQATVAEDLRERVQKAVDELGYVPNQAARALMTRRSDAIALLASEPAARVFGDPFFSGIVRGVSMETNRAGLQLVLMMAQDFEDLERVKRFLKSSPVDGVMLISGHDDDGLPEELERLHLPFVIGGRPTHELPEKAPYVDNENVQGAEVATRHLVSLGRTAIGTITGPLDMAAGIDRLTGFRNVLGPAYQDQRTESGDFTQRGGEIAMQQLLARAPDLDALFVASDLMALGALSVLRRAGRRVPDDVALVSFDDNEFATTADPPLTTIRQDPLVQGRAMVRLYLSRHRPDIELAPEEGIPDLSGLDHVILPVSLVIRESA
jgi:DNA-binding LacI/PurR family transcriptional regulator